MNATASVSFGRRLAPRHVWVRLWLTRILVTALVLALNACTGGREAVRPSDVDSSPRAAALSERAAARTSRAACSSANLEVHYINVGQGASTLIRGPDGTTMLYDIGYSGDGPTIANYLASLGIEPADGLDYVVLSHRHLDHYGGYSGLLKAGYDVHIGNLDSESSTPAQNSYPYTRWWKPAFKTTAGRPRKIKVGGTIDLGCGAEVIVAAANGYILDGTRVRPVDDNDRSISLLIRYGDFSMTLDGDLGSGSDACSGSETTQQGIQQVAMAALIEMGYVDEEHGVDVLHVAHHGSESSSSPAYYNLAKPEVALISVGLDDSNHKYGHPRAKVVETVLLGPDRPACVTAPEVQACYQTEDGLANPTVNVQRKTSNACTSAGDIILKVTPDGEYTIFGSNRVAAASDAEFIGEGDGYVVDEQAVALRTAARVAGPGSYSPFFDDLHNPVAMSNGTLVDITPAIPAMNEFDEALVELCGDFGTPIVDLDSKLAGVLGAPAHRTALDEIKKRLDEEEIFLGDGADFASDLVELWTGASGFEHVFCGEVGQGQKIGGLHFVGRYIDLQSRGQAGIAHGRTGGVFESNGTTIMSMPVLADCSPRQCYASLKGYQLAWHAVDVLTEGTRAWFYGVRDAAAGACLHTTVDGTATVFAFRNKAIRTFYPDATPDPNMTLCFDEGSRLRTGASLSDVTADEGDSEPEDLAEECGE